MLILAGSHSSTKWRVFLPSNDLFVSFEFNCVLLPIDKAHLPIERNLQHDCSMPTMGTWLAVVLSNFANTNLKPKSQVSWVQ